MLDDLATGHNIGSKSMPSMFSQFVNSVCCYYYLRRHSGPGLLKKVQISFGIFHFLILKYSKFFVRKLKNREIDWFWDFIWPGLFWTFIDPLWTCGYRCMVTWRNCHFYQSYKLGLFGALIPAKTVLLHILVHTKLSRHYTKISVAFK